MNISSLPVLYNNVLFIKIIIIIKEKKNTVTT